MSGPHGHTPFPGPRPPVRPLLQGPGSQQSVQGLPPRAGAFMKEVLGLADTPPTGQGSPYSTSEWQQPPDGHRPAEQQPYQAHTPQHGPPFFHADQSQYGQTQTQTQTGHQQYNVQQSQYHPQHGQQHYTMQQSQSAQQYPPHDSRPQWQQRQPWEQPQSYYGSEPDHEVDADVQEVAEEPMKRSTRPPKRAPAKADVLAALGRQTGSHDVEDLDTFDQDSEGEEAPAGSNNASQKAKRSRNEDYTTEQVIWLVKGVAECWPSWNDAKLRASSMPEPWKWGTDLAAKLIEIGKKCSYGVAGFAKDNPLGNDSNKMKWKKKHENLTGDYRLLKRIGIRSGRPSYMAAYANGDISACWDLLETVGDKRAEEKWNKRKGQPRLKAAPFLLYNSEEVYDIMDGYLRNQPNTKPAKSRAHGVGQRVDINTELTNAVAGEYSLHEDSVAAEDAGTGDQAEVTSPSKDEFGAHGGKHIKKRGGGSASTGSASASILEKLVEAQEEDREVNAQRFEVMKAHMEQGKDNSQALQSTLQDISASMKESSNGVMDLIKNLSAKF